MNPAQTELAEAVAHVRAASVQPPTLGIVLGSGLSAFAEVLTDPTVLPMASIPHFPVPRVSGHPGNLCLGRLGGTRIACLQGRVHVYEGHPLGRVVFGVRLLAALGCRAVFLTNAAGGIRDDLAPGDLMMISDHINLTGQSPLIGLEDEQGPRFPDMS